MNWTKSAEQLLDALNYQPSRSPLRGIDPIEDLRAQRAASLRPNKTGYQIQSDWMVWPGQVMTVNPDSLLHAHLIQGQLFGKVSTPVEPDDYCTGCRTTVMHAVMSWTDDGRYVCTNCRAGNGIASIGVEL